jgi:hypothetical protein
VGNNKKMICNIHIQDCRNTLKAAMGENILNIDYNDGLGGIVAGRNDFRWNDPLPTAPLDGMINLSY